MKSIKEYTETLNTKQLHLIYFQAMLGTHAQYEELTQETREELLRLNDRAQDETMAEVYWDLQQMYNAQHIRITPDHADEMFNWLFKNYPNIRNLIILDIWG